MWLVAGLGNPGAKYAGHRHNVGFMAVDRIAEAHGFGPWRGKFQGQIAEGRLGDEKVILLKPETYMNKSGDSIGPLAGFFKVPPEQVLVVYDELDLPLRHGDHQPVRPDADLDELRRRGGLDVCDHHA